MGKKEELEDIEKLKNEITEQFKKIDDLNQQLRNMTNNAKRFGWTEGR